MYIVLAGITGRSNRSAHMCIANARDPKTGRTILSDENTIENALLIIKLILCFFRKSFVFHQMLAKSQNVCPKLLLPNFFRGYWMELR